MPLCKNIYFGCLYVNLTGQNKPNFLLYIKMNRMMFHLLAEKKIKFYCYGLVLVWLTKQFVKTLHKVSKGTSFYILLPS